MPAVAQPAGAGGQGFFIRFGPIPGKHVRSAIGIHPVIVGNDRQAASGNVDLMRLDALIGFQHPDIASGDGHPFVAVDAVIPGGKGHRTAAERYADTGVQRIVRGYDRNRSSADLQFAVRLQPFSAGGAC